jgi:hypothetical protein
MSQVRKVDISMGGAAGVWGSRFAYCAEARLGRMYSEDSDGTVLVHLLKSVAEKFGEPVEIGKLTNLASDRQEELITDDTRKDVEPKPKRKRKGKSRQNVFDWGDVG